MLSLVISCQRHSVCPSCVMICWMFVNTMSYKLLVRISPNLKTWVQ